MNRIIGIMAMLMMINCAPSIKSSPKAISCKKVKMVLDSAATSLNTWESANQVSYTRDRKNVYVDLTRITPGYLSAWLYENDSHILFKESLPCILCLHIIPKVNRFELGTVKEALRFSEIKDRLARTPYPLMDSFRHFVELSFDENDRLELDSDIAFEPNKHYYSMAFFMAVARNNNFSDSTLFTFYKATYRGEPAIVIEVKGTFTNYYDFAQYPPLR